LLAVIGIPILRNEIKNNKSPQISAEVHIVSKYTSRNIYYVTFEFLSGDRKNFEIPEDMYGLLAEGDSGVIIFQGTRYIEFRRKYKQI
jgi:hypothetical protein